MAQIIRFEKKNSDRPFLTMQTYAYGNNAEFKTFTQAFKKADSDFKKEVSRSLSTSPNCTDLTFKLVENNITYKKAHIQSF